MLFASNFGSRSNLSRANINKLGENNVAPDNGLDVLVASEAKTESTIVNFHYFTKLKMESKKLILKRGGIPIGMVFEPFPEDYRSEMKLIFITASQTLFSTFLLLS